MTGKVISKPDIPHRCFLFFPPEAGLMAVAGTQWQCDTCRAIWTLVRGEGWVAQR
jgi:hypothetical protein